MKLTRMLSAIGIMAALAGCRTCWIDRDDDRPMKYGSCRDGLDYGWWGECFHPHYHCGPPDGIRDHIAVKKAAVKSANRALSEQDCGETSRDFRYGFQQAYIDIANGGSGALPAVPPPRYWAAPYRTTWGHNKAREWFTGYEAGATAAKCCMPGDTLSVPTSVYRDCDNRLAVGMDGGAYTATPVASTNQFASNNQFVNTNQSWSGGGAAYSPSPMIGPQNSVNSHQAGPYQSSPHQPVPYQAPPHQPAPPSMMNPACGTLNISPSYGQPNPNYGPQPLIPFPEMTAPNANSIPGGGWSSGPSPTLPSQTVPWPTIPGATLSIPPLPSPELPYNSTPTLPAPNLPIPEPTGGARSTSPPKIEVVKPPLLPPVTPMHGQRVAPSPVPQRGFSASTPWERLSGMIGSGHPSEGATR